MEPIKLQYSEALIRSAIRSYWWKQIGWGFISVYTLLIILLAYRITVGDHSWFVGMLATVILIASIMMVSVYIVHLRRSLNRLRRMNVPEAILILEEDRFRITSDIGSTETKWSILSKIWYFKNAWLLSFSEGEFMILPIANLTEDAKSFIQSKVEAPSEQS